MRIGLAVALMLVAGAVAGAQALDPLEGRASRLTVSGGSTLRSWSCATTDVNGSVRTATEAGAAAIAGLPSGRHHVAVTIPVASVDCRNGTMNGHLRRALRAEQAPEIRFELTRYTTDASGHVSAEGALSVAGRTTPVRLTVTVRDAPEGVRVAGTLPIRMTELGVEPPSLMLGTLKVHDPITIEFDVYLAQSGAIALR